ncbi:MAG: ankyrin repeat domain-containing protein [Bryobacterales bacterium]|nr:ankyrin repeat domain-containing protein [Bryobacterales bacterium]
MRALLCLAAALLCGACNERPLSPMAVAARRGDAARIAELARGGVSPDAPSGVNDWTPLMHAIHANMSKSVEALLAVGADPNLACCRGLSPLILAAGYGQESNLRALLAKGASPMHRGEDGRNALDVAIMGLSDHPGAPMGACHADAARMLLASEPRLRETPRPKRVAEALRGCPQIQKLLAAP